MTPSSTTPVCAGFTHKEHASFLAFWEATLTPSMRKNRQYQTATCVSFMMTHGCDALVPEGADLAVYAASLYSTALATGRRQQRH